MDSERVEIAQRLDQAARTLVRLGLRRAIPGRLHPASFPLRGTAFNRLGGFAVQRLRDRGRAALAGDGQYLDVEAFLASTHGQPFASMQCA